MYPYSSIKTVAIFIAVLLLCSNCSNDDDTIISYDLTGGWIVVSFVNNGTTITKTAENTWLDINNGDITANFSEPNAEGEGTISGVTVTNAYTGSYTIKEGGEITISPVATTLINEPEWTQWFQISGAEQYEIKSEQLFIYSNDKKNVIVFERI